MPSAHSCQHGLYHGCKCYGHSTELPNYRRDISNPHTLQGYYAPHGGCPCPGTGNAEKSGLYCSSRGADASAMPKVTFRAADGPHTVHTAADVDGNGRDPATSIRTTFPNSRNYGGTVAQRGPTTLSTRAQLVASRKACAEAKREERAQDRKNFLRGVLRDEMLARMDAEGKRAALEADTGLMGTNHIDEYEASQRAAGSIRGGLSSTSCDQDTAPTLGEQYGAIMDELQYVADQPVGSKHNIIRLHYLLEEQSRLNQLRWQERLQKAAEEMHSKKGGASAP
ncbi:hypothetical protein LSCM1_01475 [Leishmania martiniquensis]|uniref:Uncharacterized protein n=1 Tax=Leishmania martiniquensis TaxID=1580590 RepID=A0A836GAN8_9TRYP|nr:hypothetical protein LSCM1_01475 [Leishmania martiniquensis]